MTEVKKAKSNTSATAQQSASPPHAALPLFRAGLILWTERLLSVFWPFLSALAAGLALALTGLLPELPGYAHAVVLAVIAVALVALFWGGVKRFSAPSSAVILHHLERANRLEHRPLQTLEDRVAGDGNDPAMQALWALHQKRAAEKAKGLAGGEPNARLSKRDPFALRAIAATVLVMAFLAAGNDALHRLRAAVIPDFTGTAEAVARVSVDAWITPPDYTRVAPLFLTGVPGQTVASAEEDGLQQSDKTNQGPMQVAVPAGSTLIIQVSGTGIAVPALTGLAADNPPKVEPLGPESHRIVAELKADADLAVILSEHRLEEWQVTVQPDLPPVATLAQRQLGTTLRGSVELEYNADDDYGVEEARILIRRTETPAEPDDPVLEIEFPPSFQADHNGIAGSHFLNEVEHIWAGETVWAELVAYDALGQEGRSESLEMVLPARDFTHPVAIAIVEQRKRLALEGRLSQRIVASALRALAWDKDAYDGDVAVFLGLNLSSRRLSTGADQAVRDEMIELLWELALRLEDGNLSLAERRLREAERALQEAIARDADQQELDRLMQELQDAMNDYMQSMIQDAMERMERGDMEAAPMSEQSRMVAQQDINEIMDKIREMLQNGMKDAARRMLEQLQRMMENMQAGIQNRPSPEGMEAMEMMNGMQELMEGQRELLDRTYQNSQQRGQQGQQGTPGQRGQQGQQQGNQGQGNQGQGQQGQGQQGNSPLSADAALQEALRRQLGDIMQRYGEMMGEVPNAMGQAEGEMRSSTGALREGQAGQAVGPQGRALDQLQEASRQAQQQMMERFGNQMGQGQQASGQGENGQDMDPFGRAPNESAPGQAQGDVAIPEVSDLQRAREIRDELRRRAGQRTRPEQELDYIDRLLKQFD